MKTKQILLTLASLTLLASCGGATQTTQPSALPSSQTETSSQVSSQSSSSAESYSWSDADKALMNENLGGHILPYFDEDEQFAVTEDQGMVVVTGKTTLLIEEIAAAFRTAGFTVSVEKADGEKVLNDSVDAIVFDEDYSYLTVMLTLNADGSFQLQSIFMLASSEWPSEDISSAASMTGIESLPEFPAEGYVCSLLPEPNSGMVILVVQCFGKEVGIESVDAYGQILVDAGFTYNQDYAQLGITMYSNAQGDNVMLEYTNPGLTIMAYHVTPAAADTSFPSAEISAFITGDLGLADVVIPSYEAASYTHGKGNGYYAVMSDFDTLEEAKAVETAYVTALTTAGWSVDDTSYDAYGYLATKQDTGLILNFIAMEDDKGAFFALNIMPAGTGQDN